MAHVASILDEDQEMSDDAGDSGSSLDFNVKTIPEDADQGYVVPRRMKYEKDAQTTAGDDDDDSMYGDVLPPRNADEPMPDAVVVNHPDATNTDVDMNGGTRTQTDTGIASGTSPATERATLFENLFCLLELITEQGSGGLVDKIIIAQESLSKFINKVSPGAYTSLTKVDFKALDASIVQPIGVYGSRESIVALFLELGIVDNEQAEQLLSKNDTASREALQSGLYIAVPPRAAASELYLVYWPEKATWQDDAPSSLRRNRITFMRYLTKIAHQIICLFSDQESKAFVWSNNEDDTTEGGQDNEDDEMDRLFSFEVAKTLEQEENVTTRVGFNISLPPDSYQSDPSSRTAGMKSPVEPIVLTGEMSQGFLTSRSVPSRAITSAIKHNSFNPVQLRQFLENGTIDIDPSVNLEGMQYLVEEGLSTRFPDICKRAKERKLAIDAEIKASEKSELEQSEKELADGNSKLEDTLLSEVLKRVQRLFPQCNFDSLATRLSYLHGESGEDPFGHLMKLYPELLRDFERSYQDEDWNKISTPEYRKLKKQLITVEMCLEVHDDLPPDKKDELIRLIFTDADLTAAISANSSKGWFSFATGLLPGVSTASSNLRNRIKTRTAHMLDSTFIQNIQDPSKYGGNLSVEKISSAVDLAASYLEDTIQKFGARMLKSAKTIQRKACLAQISRVADGKRQSLYANLCAEVISGLQKAQSDAGGAMTMAEGRSVYLTSVEVGHRSYYSQFRPVKISAEVQTHTDPATEYTIRFFELSAEHRQNLQLDPKFIPKPSINERFAQSFQLPVDHSILHAQLLSNDKLLLITDDQRGAISIYLDSLSTIGNAVKNRRPRRVIRQDKIGKDINIAFDEIKRMLALHSCSKEQLYIFVFDESYASLQSWAHPVDLSRWCEAGAAILRLCFVTGSEELLLVDNQGRARIFSLITQQCRPAALQLNQIPTSVLPSPDGSCFLASFDHNGRTTVRAFHWTTFGSNEGIEVDVDVGNNTIGLTSFINRPTVHLIVFNFEDRECRSFVLDITKKATEFMFQEKSGSRHDDTSHLMTSNNCLLDCHYDVWTRFPVLPAVERRTRTSNMYHSPKRITCVTSGGYGSFSSYFSTLIKTFEQKTRKPTGDVLRSITVESVAFTDLMMDLSSSASRISQFRVGEWVVDILCLIPIHLAITRENRFIPLKDGVTSAEYERSLLGADVSTVIDSISFGWYESILQSYLASKPVKVVSSMGEQSVGKSYALNHLVDTSFAGSAMRTTEGVWMSVTPTDDAMIVALDFEGVHSIERSAQEDTLLVLFNTAISNLVLFRNNFALSRDIAGLFQSFQSSSTVFDPAANPTLFRSTLVIIIKDVVDSDKKEIVREFSLKFQKIVQEEQESNFISRLHAGQLRIVPWPVIESKQFYTLFPVIKTQLDKQDATHGNAGNFLLTMKTLMAKLKANDWRAISQSMASHRADRLLSIHRKALAYGYSEIEPNPEPLKNLDTDATIEYDDSPYQLFISDTESSHGERDTRLKELCLSWDGYSLRSTTNEEEWIQGLSTYLTHVVDTRVEHVRLWISQNLEGFQKTPHASITALHRTIDATVIDIKANVELCKQPCNSCQLLCILNRRHDGRPHNCMTSHKCMRGCEFTDEHPDDLKQCGYPAGHSGKHVCVVEDHLCGEPCVLKDKNGCLGECTQVTGHKDSEHRCSSRTHACGQPCHLVAIPTPGKAKNANAYACAGTCAISSEIAHDEHLCDNRMCPVKCELCNRLCESSDHLHSLRDGAVHLCGEAHACKALCSANGICEIDTAPQSIEATFTGRHETFQYTKYSQVAKRLPCITPIPPRKRSHTGAHTHTADPKPFHFCETRCQHCGYYCTLPLGHSQQEHETSHGSMSKTRWAIEDADAVIELNGRKFGSDDDGAPMMCSLICQDMGRHVHIDNCRANSQGACNASDVQHIQTRINPNPDQPKDWITHDLFWRRSGFKDPYSRDDRSNFAKCDAMCPGPEHVGSTSNPAQPSHCTLPLFHPHHTTANGTAGLGYTSHDGHHFTCKNPAVLQQAFHVIFVIDRSGSMQIDDRRPLAGTPVTKQIAARHDNRLGAVYSSLYSFWMSRLSAITSGQSQTAARRDSYSVILFDHTVINCLNNDFTSSPDQLLAKVMQYDADGGTNYNLAVRATEKIMRQHWSTERTPVVIFLSDGDCSIDDQDMQSLSRAAVALGKPLSFHGVGFGTSNFGTLRRMVQIAHDIQTSVPRDPLVPAAATIESSFAEALDTVRLAETFLGIAESLKKPRGALFT